MGLARDGLPSNDIDLPEGENILEPKLSPSPLTSPAIGLPDDDIALGLTLGGLVALILSLKFLLEFDGACFTRALNAAHSALTLSARASNSLTNGTSGFVTEKLR